MYSINKKVKRLVNVLAIVVIMSALGGMFDVSYSENYTMLIGFVLLVCSIWLAVLVNKDEFLAPKLD